MNLFFLHDDAREAARMQSDVHVVKMILETMQMLCTALHHAKMPLVYPFEIYKPTHINHPSSKWIRHCKENYKWALDHGHELCLEYTRRYKKIHKCQTMYEHLLEMEIPEFRKLSKNEYDLNKVAFFGIPNTVKFITIAIADDILKDCAVYDENKNILGIATYKNYYYYKTSSLSRSMKWYKDETIPESFKTDATCSLKRRMEFNKEERVNVKKHKL